MFNNETVKQVSPVTSAVDAKVLQYLGLRLSVNIGEQLFRTQRLGWRSAISWANNAGTFAPKFPKTKRVFRKCIKKGTNYEL